ncbi:hypothetical protein [Mycobacterium intracellulare]|uniref:hypothetical protein n=1 Tax=Mycobacterium intracellulare TaxID=1767 RepID=UPI0034D5B96F
MSATPENATTWRDISDLLTDRDRAAIDRLERETEGGAPAEFLLNLARCAVDESLTDTAYFDVSAPAGVTWVGEWERNLDDTGWSRGLLWRSYNTSSGVSVDIDGRQECDGAVTWHISLWGVEGGGELTSSRAREVAEVLTKAADELDRWSRD